MEKEEKEVFNFQIYERVKLKAELVLNNLGCKIVFYSPYFENGLEEYLIKLYEFNKMEEVGKEKYIQDVGKFLFQVKGNNDFYIKNRLKEQTKTFRHGNYI